MNMHFQPLALGPNRALRAANAGLAIASVSAALMVSSQVAIAVEIDPDRRALKHAAHAATGHVTCGSGSGTAQLVGSGQTIITAAHVLFGRSGLRGTSANCHFEVIVGGERRSAPIETSRVRTGTSDPYMTHASYDWAVVRLAAPLRGVTPFRLGNAPVSGQGVTLVSGRTLGVSRAVIAENCLVRAVRTAEGGREALIDCSAQSGDSGAALLDRAGRVAAIYVGFRSSSPMQRLVFSSEHYNFALPISGAMRAAVAELSR